MFLIQHWRIRWGVRNKFSVLFIVELIKHRFFEKYYIVILGKQFHENVNMVKCPSFQKKNKKKWSSIHKS